MRPPSQRIDVGMNTPQVRPHFGLPSNNGMVTKSIYSLPETKDNLFKQACIRGHQQKMPPLINGNKDRNNMTRADFCRTNFTPKLTKRENGESAYLFDDFTQHAPEIVF